MTLTASCFLFASLYYHMVWCSVTLPQTTQRYPSHPTPSTYSSTLLHPFYHQNYPHHDSPSFHLTMTPSSGSHWEALSDGDEGKCRHYLSKKLPKQKIWEKISQKVQSVTKSIREDHDWPSRLGYATTCGSYSGADDTTYSGAFSDGDEARHLLLPPPINCTCDKIKRKFLRKCAQK